MRRRILAVVLGVPLAAMALVLAWVLALQFLPWELLHWSEIRSGNLLASRVEDYRREHGYLPDPENVEEVVGLGFELRVGNYPDYRLAGRDGYEIQYYMGFDRPILIYSSMSGNWRCELCD